MNEKDVTYFSTLLNIEAEAVKAALENGGLGDKLAALNLMPADKVEKMKENYAKEVKSTHLNELIESAKKGELDKDLYGVVHGAAYEKLEKKLAKEYGVNEYDSVDDLIAKAIKNTAKPDDTKLQELLQKIEHLQEANTKLVSEKDEAIKNISKEKNDWILNREKHDLIKAVPFDFADVDDKDLEEVAAKRRKILSDVFDAQYRLGFKEDKIAVYKGEDALLDKATYEPVPLSDVLRSTAVELGLKLKSPESGGQGGKSSGSNSGKFKSVDEFEKYCESKNIQITSKEALQLMHDRGIENLT